MRTCRVWSSIGVVVLLALAGLVVWIFYVLPPSNFITLIEGETEVPSWLSQWRAKHARNRDYRTLPAILEFADGRRVVDVVDFERRRAEVLTLFESEVYGFYPRKGYQVRSEVIESGPAFDGRGNRRQVRITVSTAVGEISTMLLVYLPSGDGPWPVLLGMNFKGNPSTSEDPAVIAGPEARDVPRAIRAERWPAAELLERGYGLATLHHDDFAPDDPKRYSERLIRLFPEEQMGAIGAWAFGLSRALDYLVTDSTVDPNRIGVIGQSRLGKTALWAGAQDTRFSLVVSNCSGNTGAALSRSHRGETVAAVNLLYGYWFSPRYGWYSYRVNRLPVDQHLLLAAIAPRFLFVASASEDSWADPEGEFEAFRMARSAYALYGPVRDPGGFPSVGSRVDLGPMAYYLRAGRHDITLENWLEVLDFANRQWAVGR